MSAYVFQPMCFSLCISAYVFVSLYCQYRFVSAKKHFYGSDSITDIFANRTQNAKIVEVNLKDGYILVKGPVSGPNGSFVEILDAIKKM